METTNLVSRGIAADCFQGAKPGEPNADIQRNSLAPMPAAAAVTAPQTDSTPRRNDQLKVGIIGAGCAGMFTAMIFDHLKTKCPDLNVDYEILDASSEERYGG